MNQVFRSSQAIVRVSPPSANAQAQVDRARQLAVAGIRVPAPLADAIVCENAVITVWARVPTSDEPLDYRKLGATVAQLHQVPADRLTPEGSLPWFFEATWLQLDQRLDAIRESGVLDAVDLAILDAECHEVRGWAGAATTGEPVVCHGDVHPQNVLMAGGEIVLVDWDELCLGPPEWDHVMLMTLSDRWGGHRSTYDDFAAGYGSDLRSRASSGRLARLRLLAPTINLAARVAQDQRFAAELERRMQFWRNDPNPAVWTAQ